jgi:hypothetical protein
MGLSTLRLGSFTPREEIPVLTEWKGVQPNEKEWTFWVIILEVNTREIGQLTKTDRILAP